MKSRTLIIVELGGAGLFAAMIASAAPPIQIDVKAVNSRHAQALLAEGMQTFRYDTFGSEEFWGGKLKLHEAIEGEKLGGVGAGVSPKQAIELGLKVDMDAVPKNLAAAIKAGKVDLDDPANTLLLLKANAVVGVTGFFAPDGKSLRAVGVANIQANTAKRDGHRHIAKWFR